MNHGDFDWLNKDVMVLFYIDVSLSLGVQNFLQDNYDLSNKGNQGCGYIRTAFNYQQPDDYIETMFLATAGMNGLQANADYLFFIKDFVIDTQQEFDLTYPYKVTNSTII
jgi:hypothetical protein